MPLNDIVASREQVAASEERIRAYREAVAHKARIEKARASEVRSFSDDAGTVWDYVVLDGREVRIEKCTVAAKVLLIPATIEGLPVVALAPDSCAYLAEIEEVVCPDSVQDIGGCAFRFCTALRKAWLPGALASFESGWFRGCTRLEHLRLPGLLPALDSSIFDIEALCVLEVGAAADRVAPGAFQKSKLERIDVDPSNPYLRTDGRALYSFDGRKLIALAVPGESYCVAEGCRVIAKKGMSNFSCLAHIELPESLERLGEFALSRTGISRFDAPSALRVVAEKAFFTCSQLLEVSLNEGLEELGDHVFSNTKLRSLRIPSTVSKLGNPLAANAPLVFSGAGATVSIDEASPHFKLDAGGGLYRMESDGAHLVRLMDPAARSYEVQPGTVSIDAGAFEKHENLAEVRLPEGLRVIGDGAFKGCHALRVADLPESLERLGEEAFLDTALEAARLPRSLTHLGELALVTHGAHHGKTPPSLNRVEVASGNERFCAAGGLLLERLADGSLRLLLRAGIEEVVRIPAEVTAVAPYALNGARGIRELWLSDKISEVGIRGLAVDCFVELIHIDLVEPYQGHASFDVRFPDIDRSVQQIGLAFSVPNHVDVACVFEHYDNAVISGCNYDAKMDGGLDVYEQSTRIVERLRDPVFLTSVNKSMCERILSNNIEDICVAMAKRDDRRSIDALLDLGFLNEDNLYRVIERVGMVQDAAMTGYLLEAKRIRFGQDAFDFDL